MANISDIQGNNSAAWRKTTRKALLAARKNISPAQKTQWAKAINHHLEILLQPFVDAQFMIGLYWPIASEFDIRPAMHRLDVAGAHIALPVVQKPAAPLIFRRWWPTAPMKQGAYRIPEPDNTELSHPNVLVIPVVGFDSQNYRLGYGGGFYDRTIAQADSAFKLIGVGYEILKLDSIHPQAHDKPLDIIVTEAGEYHR